jgi:Endonuclease NucS
MAEEVRLWKIENTQLRPLTRSKLDLEQRLEGLLDGDVSVLADDLLVIGRQTLTEFGGYIDLLCLDRNGDVVIVELKRDKTPREITAQTLDYASWVRDLSRDAIVGIAEAYLAQRGLKLDEAFQAKFGSELPEVLNENHRMLIVASAIDTSSERIINYLSDQYGVDINAATFHYFRMDDGQEFLARLFLIQPEAVEHKAQTKGGSKRRRHITYDELEEQADQNGVGDLYRYFYDALANIFSKSTTTSSVAFSVDRDGSRKTVFSLAPTRSNPDHGLYFEIYVQRMLQHLGINKDQLEDSLPASRKPWGSTKDATPDYSGFQGFFPDQASVDKFLALFLPDEVH